MSYGLRGVLVGAVGLWLAVGAQARGVEGSDIGGLDGGVIVVRTYTPAHLQNDIRAARRTASAILQRVRIELDWVECGVSIERQALSTVCSRPAESDELIVRVVSAGTMDRRPEVGTLGFAFVDTDAGGGSLATIFADRVWGMAQGAGVDPADLMGKTMAHEMGHLLLGTNRHAPHGLMRASWSNGDLRRNRATEWLFSGAEGEAMRRGIASRLRPLVAGSRAMPVEAAVESINASEQRRRHPESESLTSSTVNSSSAAR